MSTSPDPSIRRERADDRLVTMLSHWLTRQLGNDELLRGVEEVGTSELAPGQSEAVTELVSELRSAAPGERGGLEMVVRETLEALADGD
jgi:hypothetical protein